MSYLDQLIAASQDPHTHGLGIALLAMFWRLKKIENALHWHGRRIGDLEAADRRAPLVSSLNRR